MVDINLTYKSRSWQREMLANLRNYKTSVIVAHRRAGKTELYALHMIISALYMKRVHPQPRFMYVAPLLKQAKAVMWPRLKFYTRLMPRNVLEADLSIQLFNGSLLSVAGADNPDGLRGIGLDGCVLDEMSQMKPDTYTAVIIPALSDQKGWCSIIGTPHGLDSFYTEYQKAKKNPKAYSAIYTVDDTDIFNKEDKAELQESMGETLYRQEFLCDFTADNPNTFIDFVLVQEALTRPALDSSASPIVLGLDVARFGDDQSTLSVRQGLNLLHLESWSKFDLMQTANRMCEAIERFKPAAVFIDEVGLGSGIVDRLRELRYEHIYGVNCAHKASNPSSYFNLKAEMWGKLKAWLQAGGCLSLVNNKTAIRDDLLMPRYEFDSQGRLKIESKDDLKARGGRSTDYADSLCLTFAMPVAAVRFDLNQLQAVSDYSLYDD